MSITVLDQQQAGADARPNVGTRRREGATLRGIFYGLLFAIPLWLTIGALLAIVL